MKLNSFPGLSRGFSAKFQGFSRVFLTMFPRKNIIKATESLKLKDNSFAAFVV